MTHRVKALGALVAVGLAVAAPAIAQQMTPEQQKADALNEEGKKLYKAQDFAAAAQKFREAIMLSPEARFYFNLCATLEKLGDYDGALEACDEVYGHAPSDELKGKTGQRAAEIRAKKRKRDQEMASAGGGGGGGGAGDGGGAGGGGDGGGAGGGGGGGAGGGGGVGGGGYVNPPAQEQVEAQVETGLNYKWSLGIEFGPALNRGVGDKYERNGQALKLHADFFLLPKKRIGLQTYLNITNIPGKSDEVMFKPYHLNIVDIGAALYWHKKLTKRLWVTPLAGAHLSGLQPYAIDGGDSFGTFGFRVEAGLQYVFGAGNHVLSFVPLCLNVYLPAAGDINTAEPARDFGLDDSGATWAITLGYTYRFQKDLFQNIVVLE